MHSNFHVKNVKVVNVSGNISECVQSHAVHMSSLAKLVFVSLLKHTIKCRSQQQLSEVDPISPLNVTEGWGLTKSVSTYDDKLGVRKLVNLICKA